MLIGKSRHVLVKTFLGKENFKVAIVCTSKANLNFNSLWFAMVYDGEGVIQDELTLKLCECCEGGELTLKLCEVVITYS